LKIDDHYPIDELPMWGDRAYTRNLPEIELTPSGCKTIRRLCAMRR
jgi:hypothetical protein